MADLIEIAKLLGPAATGLIAVVALWKLIVWPEVLAARESMAKTNAAMESIAGSIETTAEALLTIAKQQQGVKP